jgi:hypothetical protein
LRTGILGVPVRRGFVFSSGRTILSPEVLPATADKVSASALKMPKEVPNIVMAGPTSIVDHINGRDNEHFPAATMRSVA